MIGMTAPSDKLKAIDVLVQEICGQHERLEKLIEKFRIRIEEVGADHEPGSLQGSDRYWRLVAFVDSLVRQRLFLEQNLKCIETIGVLSVARYLFELTVWLKLLAVDSRYGLVYYSELLKKQLEAVAKLLRRPLDSVTYAGGKGVLQPVLDFDTEFQNNAAREISFLRETSRSEETLMKSRLSEAMRIPDEDVRKTALRQLNNEITQQIDQEAARKFSLYAEQAQTNGYEFQAYLVETKILPEYSKAIADLEQKLKAFDRDTPSEIKALAPNRWKWNKQAERVGMKDEYDFIYAYASRLLHATPPSLTTNQKNLEPDEMRVFLKYIRVRLLDAVEMAEELLAADSAVIH